MFYRLCVALIATGVAVDRSSQAGRRNRDGASAHQAKSGHGSQHSGSMRKQRMEGNRIQKTGVERQRTETGKNHPVDKVHMVGDPDTWRKPLETQHSYPSIAADPDMDKLARDFGAQAMLQNQGTGLRLSQPNPSTYSA